MEKLYLISYWYGNSKYKKEYDKIFEIFFKNQNRGNFKKTEDKNINSKLKRLLWFGNRIYRFYNDGDSFTYKKKKIYSDDYYSYRMESSNQSLKDIEIEMDNIISEIWAFLVEKHPQEIILQGLK